MTTGNSASDITYSANLPGSIVMQQPEYYFLKEQAFTQSQRYVFAGGETKHFLIDPTGYTPGETQTIGKVIIEVPTFYAESGPLEVDFYSSPVLGTAVATPLTIPNFNRYSGSAITSQVVLSSIDKAPDTPGTNFSQLLIPATSTGGGVQAGFSVHEVLPYAIDLNNPTYMSVKNQDGAGTDVCIRWNWFEI